MVGAADVDVRTQILRAATDLFAARGFDATALQAIADEVGVSKQAVLHHFPSKERLRQAVFDEILAHWTDTLPRLLLAATASNERFDAVFAETLRFFTADPARARLLAREALDRPDGLRELVRGPVRPWITAIAAYIRAGQEGGSHYADVDAEAYVAQMLLFIITSVASQPVLAAALDGKGAASRMEAELTRIARSSLFVNRQVEARAARKKGDRSWRASSETTTTSSSASKKPSTGRRSSS
ncbi:MAG: TetR family transcriptional regulator [Polyangiaceae bacterium]|nr:TetR family transcriptional regulator [Polyangiaceae bacterium]